MSRINGNVSVGNVPIDITPINIDEYRYQKGTMGSYSILTMKNYTNKCAPEFLGESVAEYKDATSIVNTIYGFSQDYETAKFFITKINTSFNGPSSNVIYCNIVYEGPVASKAHIYAYFRIYTRDSYEAEDIYRLLQIESGKALKPENMDLASKNGDLVGIKHLVENGTVPTLKTINSASIGNHLAIVKYLVDQGVKPTHETLELAIKNGSTDVVEYLTSIGIKPTQNDVTNASSNGYIQMAKALGIALFGVAAYVSGAKGGYGVGYKEGYQSGYNENEEYNPVILDIARYANKQLYNLFQ